VIAGQTVMATGLCMLVYSKTIKAYGSTQQCSLHLIPKWELRETN